MIFELICSLLCLQGLAVDPVPTADGSSSSGVALLAAPRAAAVSAAAAAAAVVKATGPSFDAGLQQRVFMGQHPIEAASVRLGAKSSTATARVWA